ncbi:MAG: hypothetical protein HQ495_01065 [Alphaproteobacteria bacterium]|nr:hypothetical protein [Alphaproteobacteria bacterium]
MPNDPTFRGRAVAAMSEAEAKRALQELLDPPRAPARDAVRPKVRRRGLSPTDEGPSITRGGQR